MKLDEIVPWGRSLTEYRDMFALEEGDKQKRILGCADGPASFNAELTAIGGQVVSVDPLYQFSPDAIRQRFTEVFKNVMDPVVSNQSRYLWEHYSGPEELADRRMSAMESFLADFRYASPERYVAASLPALPFGDKIFDLALCSHYLFLYSEQLDLEQHLQAVLELCRVAKEVRIYPLTDLEGNMSPHLYSLMEALDERGLSAQLDDIDYRFVPDALQMLRITSPV